MAVVLFHFTAYPDYVRWKIKPLANAYLCVDFFFVLSGYILARGYVGKISDLRTTVNFIVLRFGRIWPLHVFYLLAFLLLASKLSVSWSLRDFWVQVGMLHAAPLAAGGYQFNPPSWSISAEWICYVIFAAWCLCASPGLRLATCLLLAALGLAGTCLQIHSGLNDLTFATGAARGAYGFFMGVALCLLSSHRLVRLPGWAAASLLAGYFFLKPADSLWDLTAPLVFAPIVVWLASDSAQRTWLSREFAVRIGTYSYSIYLGHMLLYAIAMKALRLLWPAGPPFVIALPAVLLFVYAVSSSTYRWIEAPARRLFRSMAADPK